MSKKKTVKAVKKPAFTFCNRCDMAHCVYTVSPRKFACKGAKK